MATPRPKRVVTSSGTVAVGNIGISGESGNFSLTTSPADVTNNSVALTCEGGRTVKVKLFASSIQMHDTVNASAWAQIYLTCIRTTAGGVSSSLFTTKDFVLNQSTISIGSRVPGELTWYDDNPPAGVNTYKVQAYILSRSTANALCWVNNAKLMVKEL